MARTGTDKKSIEEQTEVIRKNNKIMTVLTIMLVVVAILQLMILLK